MTAVLRGLGAILGAAFVLAGFALPAIGVIDVGHAPGTDAFRLIQFHFVLTGVAALLAGSAGRGGNIIATPSVLLFGANLWLAYRILVEADASAWWATIFAAGSLLTLVILLWAPSATAPGSVAPRGCDDDRPPADFGVTSAREELQRLAKTIGILTVVNVVVILVLVIGFTYVALLNIAIVEGRALDFEAAIKALSGEATLEARLRIAFSVVVISVVYGLLYAFIAFLNLARRRSALGRVPDLDRALSDRERDYVRTALSALETHLGARARPARWRVLTIVAIAAFFVVMLGVPFLVYLIEKSAAAALLADRSQSADLIYYSGAFYVGGCAAAAFAGVAAYWAAMQALGARLPEFAEYLHAQTGWNSLNSRPREIAEYLPIIVRQVRRRLLDIDAPFNPYAFIVSAFREFEGAVYRITLALSAIAVGLSAADVATFDVVDDAGVTYAKHFSVETRRIDVADIDRVELVCALTAPDDDGDVDFRLDYDLIEDGEFRIDILDEDRSLADRLGRIAALDAALAAAGVPVNRAKSIGWGAFARPGFIDACASEISERYDPEIAPRLIRLIRAGPMVERQEIP